MAVRTASSYLGLFLRDIRIEHTLFALPFAYVGALFGARGAPTAMQLVWVTLAVLGARTAAMAINRYADRKIDARNPRTAKRAVAAGALPPRVMLWATGVGLLVLLLSAAMLDPLCVALLPLAALGLLIYPYCKRFTWLVHFVLGAVDGFAPLGAAIGVSGRIEAPAVLLFVAVTVWVAGFDVLYALMDLDVDRAQGIRSLPARFDVGNGRVPIAVLHGALVLALLGAGLAAHVGPPYYLGAAFAVVLLAYELALVARERDVFRLNARVFNANMLFSVAFLASTYAGFAGTR